MEEKNKLSEYTCSVDYEAECKALTETNAHLRDENYNLRMVVKHLTEVVMNRYKDF